MRFSKSHSEPKLKRKVILFPRGQQLPQLPMEQFRESMREYAAVLLARLPAEVVLKQKSPAVPWVSDGIRCPWTCSCEQCFGQPQRRETFAEYKQRMNGGSADGDSVEA